MDGQSIDIKQTDTARLRKLFPGIFSEDKIDPEKFKAAFGGDIDSAPHSERYTLNWAGKADAYRILQERTAATLKPQPELSVNFDTAENVFIEGENLEVLKVLQKSYYGKVKCIIIDPPYNTGNDSFIYPDRFKENLEEYEKRVGERDEEGYLMKEGLFRKNSKENGHYHSNWLSMMLPRLFLARNLMRDDGVIFVHIDDNEVHNLRLVMNEVFGEENFVAILKWKRKKQPSFLHGHIAGVMEYIMVFAKHREDLGKLSIETRSDANTRIDNQSNAVSERFINKGIRAKLEDCVIKAGEYQNKTMHTEYLDDVIVKNGRTVNDFRVRARFRNDQSGIDKFIKNDVLFITKNYGFRRDLLDEELMNRKSITDLLLDWGDNQDSDNEMKELFGEHKPFDYTKPTKLIYNLIKSVDNSSNDFVLDFFAGSASTAHAVLSLNQEDNGTRKFILVQLPELCDESSEAYKSGYKTISDISRERIRRVIRNLNGNAEDLDSGLGFKSYKLSPSNFKVWRSEEITEENIERQLEAFIDPVKPESQVEDMLVELILKSGYKLTEKVENLGDFYYINNELVIALTKMNQEIAAKIMDLSPKPQKVIVLDRLFEGSDELKTNTALQMMDAGVGLRTI